MIRAALLATALAACQPVGGPGELAGTTTRSAAAQSVDAFLAACVTTADTPGAAPDVLTDLGFRPAGSLNANRRFATEYAAAEIAPDGACTVTPAAGGYAATLPLFLSRIANDSPVPVSLVGDTAFRVGQSGAIALISLGDGAMTRTGPGAA